MLSSDESTDSCPSSPDDFDYGELQEILNTPFEEEEAIECAPPASKQRKIPNLFPNPRMIPYMPALPTAVPIFQANMPMMPKQHIMAFNCMPVPQNPSNFHHIAMPSNMTAADIKKRKRDERLMKNREAANKSRDRKKRNMEILTTQVSELEARIQGLSNELAASKAENTTLKGQNEFLRGLLTQQAKPAAELCSAPADTAPAFKSEVKSETAGAEIPARQTSSTASNAAGTVLFAVALSVAFISNPLNSPAPSTAGHGGRVLLSVSPLEDEGSAMNEFSVTASHHNVHHRICENVLVNVLTVLVIGMVLLGVKYVAGSTLFKKRAEFWSTIQHLLPMHDKSVKSA
jgi:hypothetical protein